MRFLFSCFRSHFHYIRSDISIIQHEADRIEVLDNFHRIDFRRIILCHISIIFKY